MSSLNHFTVSLLKMLKFRVEFNVIGLKASPWGSVLVDAIRYSDLCGEVGLALQAAEIEVRVRQVEVNDCSLGFLGSILQLSDIIGITEVGTEYGGAIYCEWKQYRFEKPLFRLGIDTLGLGTALRQEFRMDQPKCLNPPPQ